MAIKHYKEYYLQVQKMYIELLSDLHEMEEACKKGECTEEQLKNLMLPVNNLKDNYERLAYGLYLLYQPNRDKKKKGYERQNKLMRDYFEKQGITAEQELQKEQDALAEFKECIKELKKHE